MTLENASQYNMEIMVHKEDYKAKINGVQNKRSPKYFEIHYELIMKFQKIWRGFYWH